jgi:hypothetical protein
VFQQRSHQLKRYREDAEAEGDYRDCTDRDERTKVHQSSRAQERARLGGATHSQAFFHGA